ncbi:UBX domain-containing protein 6 [Daktulosphaira vitifoliae]|uniref:UBX domain-containing protein 6 n=1 Tax=Daktulosphaira vitifoliae TaxID=58002 RepID=UPI0021A9BEA0|nr:UBX domain-containing protein 6 [Daktulosphaira vitifoliae]XP_050537777.1 UBX domain-containing protein 6 [Daktulosphaira vitifoliae]
MSDKLKKFFQKKKADVKFKRAGPGHRLDEDTAQKNINKVGETSRSCRVEPTDEAKQAAAAALARFENKKSSNCPINTSLAAIKSRARRELEAEKKNEIISDNSSVLETINITSEVSGSLAANGVFFQCPMIGLEVLSEQEWHVKIEEFIKEQMKDDPMLQSILLIQNSNQDRTKVEECIKLLVTYAENIIKNVDEEKYRKIRISNKTFMERVYPIKGALEFLESIGFVRKTIPYKDQLEEFLIFPEDSLQNLALVQTMVDDLQSAERIQLVLDRNVKVLLPSQASKKVSLPSEFFIMTPEEIKAEQLKRTENLENDMILKTKNMRMKEQNKSKFNYKYCLIRVKFPDCLILQGTFSVKEHFSEVIEFVKESVFDEEKDFKLALPAGKTFDKKEENMSLMEMGLVPASILLYKSDIPESDYEHPYLKDDIMALVQDII